MEFSPRDMQSIAPEIELQNARERMGSLVRRTVATTVGTVDHALTSERMIGYAKNPFTTILMAGGIIAGIQTIPETLNLMEANIAQISRTAAGTAAGSVGSFMFASRMYITVRYDKLTNPR